MIFSIAILQFSSHTEKRAVRAHPDLLVEKTRGKAAQPIKNICKREMLFMDHRNQADLGSRWILKKVMELTYRRSQ